MILLNPVTMESDLTVLEQPRPKKCVRIAPKHLDCRSTNDVIQKPPRLKSLSLPSYSNAKPKIIIPQRNYVGYVDLASEVSFGYFLMKL